MGRRERCFLLIVNEREPRAEKSVVGWKKREEEKKREKDLMGSCSRMARTIPQENTIGFHLTGYLQGEQFIFIVSHYSSLNRSKVILWKVWEIWSLCSFPYFFEHCRKSELNNLILFTFPGQFAHKYSNKYNIQVCIVQVAWNKGRQCRKKPFAFETIFHLG